MNKLSQIVEQHGIYEILYDLAQKSLNQGIREMALEVCMEIC